MRMILIHGINQQGKSAEMILKAWVDRLHQTYAAHGPNPLGRLSKVEAAFYGDTLEELSSAKFKDQAIALGAELTTDDFDEFAHPFHPEEQRGRAAEDDEIQRGGEHRRDDALRERAQCARHLEAVDGLDAVEVHVRASCLLWTRLTKMSSSELSLDCKSLKSMPWPARARSSSAMPVSSFCVSKV